MGALFKIVIIIYILSLSLGCFLAMFRFWVDVAKWHSKEKKVEIIPSAENAILNERSVEDNGRDNERSDGDNNGSGVNNGTEFRERIIF